MCYNANYIRSKIKIHAKRRDLDFDEGQFPIDFHYVNAFSHADLPVITDAEPHRIQPMEWGLIPHWAKDSKQAVQMQKNTPNAMGETIFEKSSFKLSAKRKRCLVLANGFFEYHHAGKQKVPYFISTDQDTFAFAGLWQYWRDKQDPDIVKHTVSIITTVANPLLQRIHNNPDVIERTGGGRMPVILPEEHADQWLEHEEDEEQDKQKVMDLIRPYPAERMKYHTVATLQGKKGIGNTPEACTPYAWELPDLP